MKAHSSMKLLTRTYLVKLKKNKATVCLGKSVSPVNPSENYIFFGTTKSRRRMPGLDFSYSGAGNDVVTYLKQMRTVKDKNLTVMSNK